MSDWFNGTPELKKTQLVPYRVEWKCPRPECKTGMMEFTGESWMTNPPGHHHKCTVCDYVAALMGKAYPAIEYDDPGVS